MNNVVRELDRASDSELERVIEPLASYIVPPTNPRPRLSRPWPHSSAKCGT